MTTYAMRHTLLKVLYCRMYHLEGNKLVSTLFKAGDDLADEAALDTVRLWVVICVSDRCPKRLLASTNLDHDVGLLEARHLFGV